MSEDNAKVATQEKIKQPFAAQQQRKLTDEEVWLQGYCAALSAGGSIASYAVDYGDKALADFKAKFHR